MSSKVAEELVAALMNPNGPKMWFSSVNRL